MKIFYSWQNDIDGKQNRWLIKDALEKTVKRVNHSLFIDEPDRELELDHDTKGILGTPDLARIIFDKISESTIFIADVSLVVEHSETKKKFCNSNVMIELGHAFSELGSDRIILVMNTTHGDPSDLPFDLRHKRYPLHYSSNSNLQIVKENLVKDFYNALTPIIEQEKHKSKNILLSANPGKSDIVNVIINSDSKDDWYVQHSKHGSKQIFYYKNNVNLRFEIDFEESVLHEKFSEDWASQFPDSNAISYWFDLYYNSTLVEKFILVSVDGGRAMLPFPRKSIGGLRVNLIDFKVAQIYDRSGSLMEYMTRSQMAINWEP